MQNILSVVNGEEPEDGDWTWLRNLVSEEHVNSCQSSVCGLYKYYSNQNEHGLMDWRLGLDLLRVLANENRESFANVENLSDILSQLPENDYRSNLINYMEILLRVSKCWRIKYGNKDLWTITWSVQYSHK